MDFHGVKVALKINGKYLMHLRDNKPGLFNANMWDFLGGGREGSESPQECAIREVNEEIGVVLTPESFVWERVYPAQKDPNQKAYFMVAEVPGDTEVGVLTEGQRWELFDAEVLLEKPDVIEALKGRLLDYLNAPK